MRIILILLFATALSAGPIQPVESVQTHLQVSGFQVYGPGYLTDLPYLWTVEDKPVDYSQCGEVVVLSTLADNSPDPNGSKWHVQKTTPCKHEVSWGLVDSERGYHESPASPVPEPSMLYLVGAILFSLMLYKLVRR